MVNGCLGIAVVALVKEYNYLIPDEALGNAWGITEDDVKYIDGSKTLRKVVGHMRNAIAHFHVDDSAVDGAIVALKFQDLRNSECNFIAEVSVEHLKTFTERLAAIILGE